MVITLSDRRVTLGSRDDLSECVTAPKLDVKDDIRKTDHYENIRLFGEDGCRD